MKLKTYIAVMITAGAMFFATGAFAQIQPGFVQQDVIKISGITADAQTYYLPASQKQSTRSYYDGLGRTLQTVAIQASPLQNDMVQPVAYDNLGRQTTGYLAYTDATAGATGTYRSNAISTGQPAFYNQTGQYLIPVDADPFSSRVFENSPLQRTLQAGGVGNGYQPGQHYKTVNYRSNTNALDGNILVWNMDGTYTTGTFYADLSLSVTDGTGEDGVETQAFADLAGHTVLKRQILTGGNLDTYYIYNTAGMLIYVVPPAAVVLLAAHSSYTLSTIPLSNMVFYFVYDNQGRLTQKTVPAKGTVSTVYDPLNRPVLVQDANMNANNQWNYIKYDVKGRAISQGIYTDPNHHGLTAMQNYVNTLTSAYNTARYEVRSSAASTTGYYTNNIFPTGALTGASITPLAYAYFDDYDLNRDGTADFSYAAQSLPNESTQTTAQVKGMPTMVSKTTVGAGITANTWLTSVTFYDERLNPIQTQSNNHLNYTANVMTDYATTVPDFTGVPQVAQVSKTTVSGTGGTTTVRSVFTYDNQYRVLAVDQYYNGSTTVSHVAAYQYSEAGQLVTKNLGYTGPTTWLQTVNMRYTIRGQLLSLNNATLTTNVANNTDPHAVFGMELLYETTDGYLGNRGYYDGKVSGIKWASRNAGGSRTFERAYKYLYDGVDRYTGESYAERDTLSSTIFANNIGGFDESSIIYDANGNLQTLKRNSSAVYASSHLQIDNLHYYYSAANPNQLQSVTDGMTAQYTGAGFRNLTGADTTHHYIYDFNGNLTADPFKGLTKITYDVLNRTDTIKISGTVYTTYAYDATGALIRKKDYSSSGTTTTDYIGGFVYVNSVLSYCPMPEGRLVMVSGTLKQEYIITDQQGNARVSFQDNGAGVVAVKQETSYYGFGLQLPNSPVTTLPTPPNKQLYNGGSEWQNNLTTTNLPDYYQTFNRNYDAAIGRFIGVDPQAESAESMSSYQYAGNNPVMMNDPMGNKLPNGAFIYDGHAYDSNGMAINVPANYSPGPGGGGMPGGIESDTENLDDYALGIYANLTAQDPGDDDDNTGDYSSFWTTAIGIANQINEGLKNTVQNGWHFSGTQFAGLDELVSVLGDNAQLNLTAYSDGSTNWSLQNNISFGGGAAGGTGTASGNPGSPGQYNIGAYGNLPGYNPKTQIGALCVFYTAAEIKNFFTGRSESGTDLFYLDFATIKGLSVDERNKILAEGEYDPDVLNTFFVYRKTSDITGALLAGHPVMATIEEYSNVNCVPGLGPNGIGFHEVFVTGISYFWGGLYPGLNYTFYNSQTNHYENLPPFEFHFAYEIDSLK